MKENTTKISINNIFDSIYAKMGLSAYTLVISVIVSYFTSKVFYEMLWPNERFTVCAFMTVSLMLAYGIMIYRLPGLKAVILFHFVLIFTPLSMVLPYEYRIYPTIILVVALFSDFYVALVSAVGICSYGFVSMASEPEFFFTIITLITGISSLIVGLHFKSFLYKVYSIVGIVLLNGILHVIFIVYCEETYIEYDNAGFIFSCMFGVLISLILYIVAEFMHKKYVLKQALRITFIRMRQHNYKPHSFLKSKSAKLYEHCTKVAILAESAAKSIGADEDICYVGGMFHDVGKMFGSDYIIEGVKFGYKYQFPQEIIDIIGSHAAKDILPKNKEEGIVLLADTVVSSISYMMSKDENVSVKKIVDNALMNRLTLGVLNSSNLSALDMHHIRESFVKELEKEYGN